MRRRPAERCHVCAGFLLTHLLRGATIPLLKQLLLREISTHAPLARCDKEIYANIICKHKFLLTHLLRGATTIYTDGPGHLQFLLTHLLRGATTFDESGEAAKIISTHAPLARCDVRIFSSIPRPPWISTHAPLARCDCYNPFVDE